MSPQYSVLRGDMPFERRWMHDWRRIRAVRNLGGSIANSGRIVIAYDPKLPNDRRHAELVARDAPHTELLALPYAGHPAGPFLSEAGLLRRLVSDILNETFEKEPFELAAREARKRCSTWLDGIAHRQPAWRPRTAVALARKGVEIAPHNAVGHNRLGICLRLKGDFDAAIAAHRHALALLPAQDFRWQLSQTLLAASRYEEALDEIGILQATSPQVARFHSLAALAQAGRGEPAAALVHARTANRLACGHWKYRWLAVKLAGQATLAQPRRFTGSSHAEASQ